MDSRIHVEPYLHPSLNAATVRTPEAVARSQQDRCGKYLQGGKKLLIPARGIVDIKRWDCDDGVIYYDSVTLDR